MGKTVRQLLSEMDSMELTEWMAYDQVEPFGEWRADLRAGIVASTIANALRGRGSRPLAPEDFIPRFAAREQQELSVDETIAAFAAAFGVDQIRR